MEFVASQDPLDMAFSTRRVSIGYGNTGSHHVAAGPGAACLTIVVHVVPATSATVCTHPLVVTDIGAWPGHLSPLLLESHL